MKIGSLREYPVTNADAEVGVEIEMEAFSSLYNPSGSSLWRITGDGSLRGDYNGEYVLITPESREMAKSAVEELYAKLATKGTDISETIRAGVHIHINVKDMTIDQLLNYTALYYVLEECLVEWCGPNRIGNHFCLRVSDAEQVLEQFAHFYKSKDIFTFDTDGIRYSSLNFAATFKYGSVEFRALETPSRSDRIIQWIDVLTHLKDKAISISEAESIIEEFSGVGATTWARDILGDHFKLIEDQPDLDRKLKRGMRMAQDLIFFSKV